MNRTQIYLPKSQLDQLNKIAHQRKTTVSQVVRDLIDEKIKRSARPVKKHESILEAAKRIQAMGFKGPKDLATNLDEYLYGGKK